MKPLRLYSRAGCDLCEDLEQALYDHFAGQFQLDWRDVDREAVTRVEFGHRIPVLTRGDGTVLCEYRLDAQAVRDYLAAP